MSVARHLSAQLQTLGQGTEGTNLFVNILPENPAACMALFDLSGPGPRYAMRMSPVNQDRFVQIQVRDANPSTAETKCAAAVAALVSGAVTLSGQAYEMIRPRTAVALLQRDENNLTVFYCEIEAVMDLG